MHVNKARACHMKCLIAAGFKARIFGFAAMLLLLPSALLLRQAILAAPLASTVRVEA